MMSLSANRVYQEPSFQSHFYPAPPKGPADGPDSKHLPFSTLSHFLMHPPQKEDLSPLAYSTYSFPTITSHHQALLQYSKYQPPPIPRTTHPSQLNLANINFSGGNFNGSNFNAVNCSGVNFNGGNVNGGNSSIPHFNAPNSNTNTNPPPRNSGPINMGSPVNLYKGREIHDGPEHKEKNKGKETMEENVNSRMKQRAQEETGREEKGEAVQKNSEEKWAVKEEADWRSDAKREAVNLRREGSYMAQEWVRHDSENSLSSTEWESPHNKRPRIQISCPRNLEKSPLLSCEHCGKTFAKAYNLRSHARSHSTERPYKCRQCPKAFARSHDKTRHEQLHRGMKNFKCEGFLKDGVTKWGCGKSFARSDALSRHFRTETGWGCVRVFMEEAKTPISDHATVPEHMPIPSGSSQEHLLLPSVYSSPESFSSSPIYGVPLYAGTLISSSPPASSFYQAVASKQTDNVQVIPQLSLPPVSCGYYPVPVQNDRSRSSHPVVLPPLLRY